MLVLNMNFKVTMINKFKKKAKGGRFQKKPQSIKKQQPPNEILELKIMTQFRSKRMEKDILFKS